MCQIKFILTGQAPKLTGKCLVTGCYYKHCIAAHWRLKFLAAVQNRFMSQLLPQLL